MLRPKKLLLTLVNLWKGKPESTANSSQPNQRAKKKAPGHKYKDREHSTEEEHRTAEQHNWRRENVLAFLTTVFAAGAVVFAFKTFVQTKRQADIAQSALLSSNRAWIDVDIVPGPVSLMWNEKGAHLSIVVTGENVGGSPALTASVTSFLAVSDIISASPDKIVRSSCIDWIPFYGNTLFMRGKTTDDHGASIEMYDVNRAVQDSNKYDPQGKSSVEYYLITCANYKIIGDAEWHHTGRLYQVGRFIDRQGHATYRLKTGEELPSGSVALSKVDAGDYTN